MADNPQTVKVQEDTEPKTKMLGAHVEMDLYWEFKKAAAEREESVKDAIIHAARMYISAPSATNDVKGG